jgi:ZIP zinc/iron transport family
MASLKGRERGPDLASYGLRNEIVGLWALWGCGKSFSSPIQKQFMNLLTSISLLVSLVASQNSDNSTIATSAVTELAPLCIAEPVEYNTSWRIAAVFIVFGAAALGSIISSTLGARALKQPSQHITMAFHLLKMFGVGVIASTAWIHLLVEAFEAFSSPCLPEWWAGYGAPWVGVFGLFAAFAVQLIELAGHSYARTHHSSSESSKIRQDTKNNTPAIVALDYSADPVALPTSRLDDNRSTTTQVSNEFVLIKSISTIVLEMGILLHSVIIGIALGVTGNSEFFPLLIAISFHQLFEGMALVIILSESVMAKWLRWTLLIAYPLSTSLGTAIGIGLQSTYNESDGSMVLMRGIFDSLSSGILIYNTYCTLVGGEINHNSVFTQFTPSFKVACFGSMYFGAAAMALIGKWA